MAVDIINKCIADYTPFKWKPQNLLVFSVSFHLATFVFIPSPNCNSTLFIMRSFSTSGIRLCAELLAKTTETFPFCESTSCAFLSLCVKSWGLVIHVSCISFSSLDLADLAAFASFSLLDFSLALRYSSLLSIILTSGISPLSETTSNLYLLLSILRSTALLSSPNWGLPVTESTTEILSNALTISGDILIDVSECELSHLHLVVSQLLYGVQMSSILHGRYCN